MDIEKKRIYDRERARKWRTENREKSRELVRKYRLKHRDEQLKRRREKLNEPGERDKINMQARMRRAKNPEKYKENQKRHLLKIRKLAIEKLGGKCSYCGCDVFEALEINHKNGGGRKELTSKRGSYGFLRDILSQNRSIDDLEIVCRICNAWHYLVKIKGLENCWEIKFVKHNL